jgi:hypothetical protein
LDAVSKTSCHPEGGSATEGSMLIQARFFASLRMTMTANIPVFELLRHAYVKSVLRPLTHLNSTQEPLLSSSKRMSSPSMRLRHADRNQVQLPLSNLP